MTKKMFAFAFTLILVASAFADSYKLLAINSGTININGKDCKVGDIFADDAEINWSSDMQAIQVQNTTNKRIMTIAAMQQKKTETKSIFDIITKTGILSTRGDGLMTIEGLEEYLSKTFYLLDEERVESMLETTKKSYFQVEFSVKGKSYKKKLKGDKKSFTLDATTFKVPGAEGMEIPVKISYIGEKGSDVVTDKMKVVVLPKNIK